MNIELLNGAFFYEKHPLFQGLNLSIPANACTCLLGPSGVGKSSLLHAIAGISLGEKGHFFGVIQTSDGAPLKNRVMLMSQQDALLPWLNVVDNVLLGYRLRNEIHKDLNIHAKNLLQEVGLSERDFSKKPQALSGGMRQRVALVRTVIENKPVWLLDEPFSALDAITRYKLQNLLPQFWKNKTVLLVTHDPLEALRLADHIYVMRGMPAQLEKIELPASLVPRELTPEVLAVQGKILETLK